MGNASAVPATDSIQTALADAAALLDARPDAALAQAEVILRRAGRLPPAELLIGQALRRLGKPKAALARLNPLARQHPTVPAILWELAQAAQEAGDHRQAIGALESLTRQQPGVPGGWFLLAGLLRTVGRDGDAWRADLSGVHAASRDRDLLAAAMAMNEGRLDDAATLLSARADRLADDPAGTRLMGEVQWRRGDMNAALAHVEHDGALDMSQGRIHGGAAT